MRRLFLSLVLILLTALPLMAAVRLSPAPGGVPPSNNGSTRSATVTIGLASRPLPRPLDGRPGERAIPA